jgi:hypothetical protein
MKLCYDDAMIRQIYKAMLYRDDPHCLHPNGHGWIIKANHAEHYVTFDGDLGNCDCEFFARREICWHVMLVERELQKRTQAEEDKAERFVTRFRPPRESEQGGGRCQTQTAPITLS